jgi:chromosome segregation ATPase
MLKKAVGAVFQSEMVAKILQNEALVTGILKAVSTSIETKEVLGDQYEHVLSSLSLAPASRVEELASLLAGLEEEAIALKAQLVHLSTQGAGDQSLDERIKSAQEEAQYARGALQTARESVAPLEARVADLEEEAEGYQRSLAEAHERAERAEMRAQQAETKLENLSQEEATPALDLTAWSPDMTKVALIQYGRTLGAKVNNSLTKSEIIRRIRRQVETLS